MEGVKLVVQPELTIMAPNLGSESRCPEEVGVLVRAKESLAGSL